MDVGHERRQKSGIQVKPAYRVLREKKDRYVEQLAHYLHEAPPLSWESLKGCILRATHDAFTSKNKDKKHVRGLPHKSWFDEECKTTRAYVKRMPEGDAKKKAEKKYHALTRKKRRTYAAKKEPEDEHMFKPNPKKAWKDAKGQKEDIMGDFTDSNMRNYVTQLYTHENVEHMDGNEIEVTQDHMFSPNDVAHALKKMANGKAHDLDDIYIELLKWAPIETHVYLQTS